MLLLLPISEILDCYVLRWRIYYRWRGCLWLWGTLCLVINGSLILLLLLPHLSNLHSLLILSMKSLLLLLSEYSLLVIFIPSIVALVTLSHHGPARVLTRNQILHMVVGPVRVEHGHQVIQEYVTKHCEKEWIYLSSPLSR